MDQQPILKGIPTSQGTAEGIVRIIADAADEDIFQEGDILVTTITDPTMVAMMSKAAGIICDIGSITSHPSIISRELGIPCIVNTKTGTSTLTSGMQVRMDATTGNIYQI